MYGKPPFFSGSRNYRYSTGTDRKDIILANAIPAIGFTQPFIIEPIIPSGIKIWGWLYYINLINPDFLAFISASSFAAASFSASALSAYSFFSISSGDISWIIEIFLLKPADLFKF